MNRLAKILALALILQTYLPASALIAQTTQDRTSSSAVAKSGGKSTRPAAKGSQSVPADFAKAIKLFDDFAARQMAIDKTPGMTIGFMKGDFVWSKGYGFADLENRVPAKPESAYRLASVTKPMTALAIMQLAEKGKLNLDAEVQTYVPYFPKKPWPVTVRQVVGHLGGISHYKNPAQELHIKDQKTTREAIAIFENFDLVAEPGTQYSYSSYGYNLLGAVIESASGMSYSDYMRQNIWQPLGMNDTRMDDPLEVIPNRVRGYQLIDGKVKNSEFVNISSRFAAGGTRSTVPDLFKFARGIIDLKLISAESMNVVSTSMSTKVGRLTDYSMGWETTPYNGRYMLVHSGGQQETRTLLYILPAWDMAVAVGVNFEGSNPGAYLERLFQLITGTAVDLDPYSSDKTKAALAEGVKLTFNYGLSDFQRTHRTMAANEADLVEAFAYFNEQLNPAVIKDNSPATLNKIRDGVHPVAKQAFTKVGSYMALKLAEKNGAASLNAYPERGALAFFQDYIVLSAKDASIRKELRLNEAFAVKVSEMASDWSKTNSAYIRGLWLTPDSNLDEVARELRKTFTGVTVYPSVLPDFFNITRQALIKGDRSRGLESSKLTVELYPEAPTANLLYGISLILNNDSTGGLLALKRSLAIDPNGAASAGSLNNIAYQLAGGGQVDPAMAVLRAAVELHPKEANLYDSMGEFQLKKGEKAKALESYKKALEMNPNFENAANAREIVKKLQSELGGGQSLGRGERETGRKGDGETGRSGDRKWFCLV